MRVLIIKTSALGDIIHALPVIGYLRQVSPDIEIDWVVEEPFLPLLEHNPGLRNIIRVKTRKWRKNIFSRETRCEIQESYRKLRKARYDVVFDLQGNTKSGIIVAMTGVAERVGFTREWVQERFNLLFTTRKVRFRPCDDSSTKRYLRVVSDYFGRDYTEFEVSSDIFSSPEDEAAADDYMSTLPAGPVFFFQVGTTWESKLWYMEGWCELAKRINERFSDATILINWGNPAEKELGEQIARIAGSSVHLLPWLTVRALIPVIRRVDLVIGGDTGPLYMAAAVGTPTVSFYRATDASVYGPRGPRHISIQTPLKCAGCQRTSCNLDDECRHSITPDSLFDAVCRLMNQDTI